MVDWLKGITHRDINRDGGSFTSGPGKIVLHTTETRGRPSYQGGAVAPHLDIAWTGTALDVVQYIPLDRAARALRNAPGGVQTNRDTAYQIELIGTSSPAYARRYGGTFWGGDPGDDALKALGVFLRRLASEVDVPLRPVADWAPLNASGVAVKSYRMSLAAWDGFAGICGHQHVPENTHVDPGGMDVARALALSAPAVGPKVTPVTPQSKPTPVAPKAPPWPLRPDAWFGVQSADTRNHSGYYSAGDRIALRVWQAKMKARGWSEVTTAGLFDDPTHQVVLGFQEEKHLHVDGKIGPQTWAAAWSARVT